MWIVEHVGRPGRVQEIAICKDDRALYGWIRGRIVNHPSGSLYDYLLIDIPERWTPGINTFKVNAIGCPLPLVFDIRHTSSKTKFTKKEDSPI